MKPLRLMQITDLHFAAEAHQTVHGLDPDAHFASLLPLILDWQPQLVLATGDLADEGDASAYQRLGSTLNSIPCPLYALPGNHDAPALMRSILEDHAIGMPPRVQQAGWSLHLLDSTVAGEPGGHLEDEQLQSLAEALEADPDDHHMVFVHHHPLHVDSPWIDCQRLANGETLIDMLAAIPGVKALCWGHIHHRWEGHHEHLALLGTPATAGQAKARQMQWVNDDFGPRCRWFELHPDGSWHSGILEAPLPMNQTAND